jgi:hypothetical protein
MIACSRSEPPLAEGFWQSETYPLVNPRLGKQWGAWRLSAWTRNLFDENTPRDFYFGNEPTMFENTLCTKFSDPRTYGFTLGYN